jgi:hypothetical protein
MSRFGVRKAVAVCVALGFGAFVLTGCATLTGGGWMFSAVSGKATFGVNMTCDGNGNLVGDWTYHDKAAGVDIAGTVTADAGIDCNSGSPGGEATWYFDYTAQHCTGDCSGTAELTVFDGNTGGKLKGDTLSISLAGGPDDGYSNSGPVRGGNLVVTGAEN